MNHEDGTDMNQMRKERLMTREEGQDWQEAWWACTWRAFLATEGIKNKQSPTRGEEKTDVKRWCYKKKSRIFRTKKSFKAIQTQKCVLQIIINLRLGEGQ